jgi:XTP/dITP diphosphohydrolase
MKLLIATKNENKLKEIKEILDPKHFEIFSFHDIHDLPDIEEDGDTFEANALKKARVLGDYTKMLTLADDSGLMVDAINGEPGVYSSRYGGVEKDYDRNNTKLLEELKDISEENRTACFVCCIVLYSPLLRKHVTFRGECKGKIGYELSGMNGFGYDPLFIVPQFNRTFAELEAFEKNSISHRGKALKLFKDYIDYYYGSFSRAF